MVTSGLGVARESGIAQSGIQNSRVIQGREMGREQLARSLGTGVFYMEW